ncbi:MAG: 3-hydroxyacyl-CoA dehydrogenase [Hyphomicrobiaceae bacterium]
MTGTAQRLKIGVVGTGAMGRGIAQVSAEGGAEVRLFDAQVDAAGKAREFIKSMVDRAVAKGTRTEAQATDIAGRVTIADKIEELAGCDLIVEAIVEKLDAKQQLFAALDGICGPDTILASNTSSLPITAIAAKCTMPERVAGLHFFNPVPLMKLVEVIPGLKTKADVIDRLVAAARLMTREPVVCTDSPGFIVNHIGRAYVPEAGRIVSEGIATHDEIDRIMTATVGMRMGPFQLLDLVGADVSVAVMESLYGQFYQEPMYAPQPIMRSRVDGGAFGQKSGGGWYTYKDGKRVDPAPKAAPTVRPKSVWVWPSPTHADLQKPLIELFQKSGTPVEAGEKPSDEALVVVTPVGYDLTTAITDLKLDGSRTVAVDVMFGLDGIRTLMVTPAINPVMRDAAHALLAADGGGVVVINDSPGFIAQRLVAHIINVGCQIAQRQVATPVDIDKGAKLGLAYPFGPLAWGDKICPGRVMFILERLATFYGEPRYRPSPWLKRRAALGLSLLTPEGKG